MVEFLLGYFSVEEMAQVGLIKSWIYGVTQHSPYTRFVSRTVIRWCQGKKLHFYIMVSTSAVLHGLKKLAAVLLKMRESLAELSRQMMWNFVVLHKIVECITATKR
jgi:hypothetical protein